MKINIRNKKTYYGEGEYIGRNYPSSILRNEFRISEKISREKAVYLYGLYLKEAISAPFVSSLHEQELNRLFSILVDKQELNLICHCFPKLCHGNIIKQLLSNKYYHGTWLVNGYIGITIEEKTI